MDGICRILRPYVWCCLLLCLLSVAANSDAATRKFVKLPSKSVTSQNPSLLPTRSGDLLQTTGQALEGELLDPEGGTKGVPIKVLPRLDGSLSRMFNHMKTGMKGGVIGMAGSVGLALLLDQIDAVIEEGGTLTKTSLIPSTDLSLFWCGQLGSANCKLTSTYYSEKRYSDPTNVAFDFTSNSNRRLCSFSTSVVSATRINIQVSHSSQSNNCASPESIQIAMFRHGACAPGSTYSEEKKQCLVPGSKVPLEDSDYDLMFDHASQQNAEWLTGLLNDYCKGSTAPERCFSDMWDQSPLSGPATVKGPSKTSTTTSVGADGLVSEKVVTSTTNFDITYGDNYYDYRKSVITTTTVDGVTESETTESEPDEVEQEEKPQEEKEEEKPVPCEGSNCDGPAYKDLYSPTEDTKEDYLDDYVSRVSNLPILVAVGNLFEVSVSGSCPVWEYHHALAILGTTWQIDLVFNFFCLPWFVALGPWIQVLISLVATYGAIRIALL